MSFFLQNQLLLLYLVGIQDINQILFRHEGPPSEPPTPLLHPFFSPPPLPLRPQNNNLSGVGGPQRKAQAHEAEPGPHTTRTQHTKGPQQLLPPALSLSLSAQAGQTQDYFFLSHAEGWFVLYYSSSAHLRKMLGRPLSRLCLLSIL